MTAIINCRHSTIRGGIRRIQQCWGKRKTKRKPRTELSVKNTAGRVPQTRNPEENLCWRHCHPSQSWSKSSLQGSLYHNTGWDNWAAPPTEPLPGAWTAPPNCKGKGFAMLFALIVLIIIQLKYQRVFEKHLSEIPLISWFFQNPYPQMCACSKMAQPSFTQNLLSHT